ncbi:MAG TPA: glycosyltransferase, partial [Gemmatimonadales bacterium]|nr:glycosyltransferase [Gemmatimonadales bacterium]
LFGTTAFREVSWPMAVMVWAAEKLIPSCYRKAWFHAISESTRDDLVGRGVPRERIAVVHPGVDSTRYHPATDRARIAPPTFVYLGRLKRYKGVDFLLEAMSLVAESHHEMRLVVAGGGDDRPRLETLARRLGVSGRVEFAGFVDETEKLRLLRGAVANVFPSPKEGWGITVMEAAACGTPSLASDSPGLRDSVRDGQTGILVPHGDPAALAAAMTGLVEDAELASRLGDAAREHALVHTWQAAVDQVEAHLVDLARDGAIRPADIT